MTVRRHAAVGAAALAALALTWPRSSRADEPSSGASAPATTLSVAVTSKMTRVREGHVAVRLGDGRVLVAGGRPGDAAKTAEIFDPKSGAWTPTKTSMLFDHNWPVAAPLCDGRVFVAGRYTGGPFQAEIYDPVADEWSDAGETQLGHLYGVATLLADCRVLLSGGYSANRLAEIYDPMLGTYKIILPLMQSERFFHTATLMPDGQVLAVGGGVDINGAWFDYPTVDLLDPVKKTWMPRAPLHRERRAHTATLLPDGRVLVAGGLTGGKNTGSEGPEPVDSAEIYDPVNDVWEELPAKLVTARGVHTAALMPSGALLLFGGLDSSGSASRSVEGYFEGVFTALPPLLVDRFEHAAATLGDGRVLLVGGAHQATGELYALAQPGEPCDGNLRCASGFCTNGVCCGEACTTGCRRCDVPGKEGVCSLPCGDAEHASVCADGTTTCLNETCVALRCAPLLCDPEQGVCREGCASVEDCAPGYACDFGGQCVSPPDVSATDEEACSASAGSKGGAAGALAALFLAALALSVRGKRA